MSPVATDELRAAFGEDVLVLDLVPHADERGRLLELDFSIVPFAVKRAFCVADVPAGTVRGGHRHRSASQVLACVSGRVEVELRRGKSRLGLELTPGSWALCLAAGVWSSQRYVEDGSVLVVLASEPFDPDGYDDAY